MFKIILLLTGYLFCAQFSAAQSSKQLKSPNGNLQFVFNLSNEGSPVYSISYQQNPIVLSSALGLNGWEKGFVLSNVSFSKQDTVWKPVYGERSQVRDHYEQMVITLLRQQ